MARMGFFSLLFVYLKRHAPWIALLCAFSAVFAAVFALYNLPAEAVAYACAICLALGAIAAACGLSAFRRRHEALLALKNRAALSVEDMPAPRDLIESDLQEIIRALQGTLREERSRADREREEMLEYYTLWVHQAKTPLSAMSLLLSGREEAAALEAERFKMERYVDMALQYARLGADASDFVLRECELAPIVRGAVRKYARLFIAKRIHLQMDALDARVLTDDKWLGFAVEQLLSNAVKYTGENGHIRISLSAPLTLVIEDDGIGIRPEDLPRVFEKGYTGFNGRAGEKATGIGLYLCRKTLERLSHTIRLESSPGSGTRAIVGLDAVRVPFD